MDVLALEAKNVNGAETEKKSTPRTKPKPPKKAKRIVYFEVEIVDLKTKEKLLLLDKVSVLNRGFLIALTFYIDHSGFRRLISDTKSAQELVSINTVYHLPVDSF